MDEALELGTEYRYHFNRMISRERLGVRSSKTLEGFVYERVEMLKDMLSIKKFDEWLNKSRSGQKISYYRGFLFAPNQQKLSPTLDLNRVKRLADHVRNAYNNSLITMVQKRHDDFDYEYIAIRL